MAAEVLEFRELEPAALKIAHHAASSVLQGEVYDPGRVAAWVDDVNRICIEVWPCTAPTPTRAARLQGCLLVGSVRCPAVRSSLGTNTLSGRSCEGCQGTSSTLCHAWSCRRRAQASTPPPGARQADPTPPACFAHASCFLLALPDPSVASTIALSAIQSLILRQTLPPSPRPLSAAIRIRDTALPGVRQGLLGRGHGRCGAAHLGG